MPRRRNTAWSFFTQKGCIFDISKHFVSTDMLQLKTNFKYPNPKSENQRMDYILKTIEEHYKINKEDLVVEATRVSDSFYLDGHCEFTGGGDIFIMKEGTSLSISNVESVPISPVRETEATSSQVVEGKNQTVRPQI